MILICARHDRKRERQFSLPGGDDMDDAWTLELLFTLRKCEASWATYDDVRKAEGGQDLPGFPRQSPVFWPAAKLRCTKYLFTKC